MIKFLKSLFSNDFQITRGERYQSKCKQKSVIVIGLVDGKVHFQFLPFYVEPATFIVSESYFKDHYSPF